MNPKLVADANFFKLSENPYPGRGLIVGKDETGKHLVQGYWIMGRSENSRNRIFSAKRGRLFTEAADSARMKYPSLVIYNAMDEVGYKDQSLFVVSNGDQTDSIIQAVANGEDSVGRVLAERQYEPDEPNFTPRIIGVSYLEGDATSFVTGLSILRKSDFGDACDRFCYQYNEIAPGFGFCLTTYAGDGTPLPPFRGEPLLMPLVGDMQKIAETYWNALNEENRVSLAVKFIEIASETSRIHIINKYRKV